MMLTVIKLTLTKKRIKTMADKALNVIQDQDFYGDVRFFGNVTMKDVGGSQIFSGDVTIGGVLSVTGNISTAGALAVTGNILMAGVSAPAIYNEVPSNVNPTLSPNKADDNTGIGWEAADQLALIAAGKHIARIDGAGLQNLITQTVEPNAGEVAGQTLLTGVSQVEVDPPANDANDFITLPLAAGFPIGHQIVIQCNGSSNFEMRTLEAGADTINNVDCSDGGTEYLCTDTDTIVVTVTGATSFIATSYTNLGAVRTAVVPD